MTHLFTSDNVVVRNVPMADVRHWVVTFDSYGLGPGFDRPGFGEDFLRQAGVSALHVMSRREDWYQYPEMAAVMAVVRRATAGAARVMTYGSSMGGYAALRFADAAGANAVLAISPQYSADPAKVPFEERWPQDSRRISWRPEIDGRRLSCSCRPLVVFDATGNDLRHAQLIAEEVEADLVGLRYVHHPATTYLSEKQLLGPLVLDLLRGDLDVDAFRRRAAAGRRDSVLYLSRLAGLQPPHRRRTGRALATRALERGPDNALAMMALAAHLTAAGEHDAAVALHQRATALGQRGPGYLVPYADALMAAGRVHDALPLVREAVGLLPGAAHLWNWQGLALWLAGDRDGAIASMERAVGLGPSEPEYRKTLDWFVFERGT